jgi:hypothetical protein
MKNSPWIELNVSFLIDPRLCPLRAAQTCRFVQPIPIDQPSPKAFKRSSKKCKGVAEFFDGHATIQSMVS